MAKVNINDELLKILSEKNKNKHKWFETPYLDKIETLSKAHPLQHEELFNAVLEKFDVILKDIRVTKSTVIKKLVEIFPTHREALFTAVMNGFEAICFEGEEFKAYEVEELVKLFPKHIDNFFNAVMDRIARIFYCPPMAKEGTKVVPIFHIQALADMFPDKQHRERLFNTIMNDSVGILDSVSMEGLPEYILEYARAFPAPAQREALFTYVMQNIEHILKGLYSDAIENSRPLAINKLTEAFPEKRDALFRAAMESIDDLLNPDYNAYNILNVLKELTAAFPEKREALFSAVMERIGVILNPDQDYNVLLRINDLIKIFPEKREDLFTETMKHFDELLLYRNAEESPQDVIKPLAKIFPEHIEALEEAAEALRESSQEVFHI